ncbi:hypothetical protein [Photorhabdus australis]|uniref:hypothetical protein n=1 Tax=Photorhabdus australis TaxID=286156 RepID=UPI0009431C17
MGKYRYIPVIFQVASLLAALTHPGHIVIYVPGDSLLCRRDASSSICIIISPFLGSQIDVFQ